jgi:hypothetical protein
MVLLSRERIANHKSSEIRLERHIASANSETSKATHEVKYLLALAVFLIGVAGTSRPALAQQHRLLPVSDPAYRLIEQFQRRGRLLDLNPTALPYEQGAVRRALDDLNRDALSLAEARWARRLERMLPHSKGDDEMVVGGRVDAGLRSTNNGRLDPLRHLDDDLPPALSRGALHGFLERGPLFLHAGAQHDLYYDRDPDGLDAARRLYGRSEPTYASATTDWAALRLGRFSAHWGLPERPGLVVSDNPRAYDQLALRLGRGPLVLRSLLGELDPLGPDSTFTGMGFRDGSRPRYLAAHRLDWRPSRRLTLTLMESILYSGPDAGPSLKYLNPLHPFYFVVANRPRHHQTNGLIAAQLWTQPFRRVTIWGQLLVDDFDFVNGEEPASVALTGTMRYASRSAWDVGGGLTLVAARTYNTNQNAGKYLYLKRGLGTEFNDYAHVFLDANWHLGEHAPGLSLRPQLHALWQGERRILDDYANVNDEAAFVLDGTPERTLRPALEVRLGGGSGPARWWLHADAGVNFTANDDHESGASTTHFIGVLEAGARLSLETTFSAL